MLMQSLNPTQRAFERFDAEHPEFYRMFCHYTLQLIGAGHKRLSSKLIVERIRWERMLEGGDVHINNNFTPYFARKFMADFPNHEGVFETRSVA